MDVRNPHIVNSLDIGTFHFQNVDPELIQAVKDSIKRHLWYLTEECVVFSLFDKELSHAAREEIAAALLLSPIPAAFLPVDVMQAAGTTLASFVGPSTWLAFDLLDSGYDWLNLPSAEWSENPAYNVMEGIISDLSVVNDTAERAVKNVTDYADSANDGGHRGRIIEVAMWLRANMPSFDKGLMEDTI